MAFATADARPALPGSLTQAIRNFAKSLEGWLTNAMSDFPQQVVQTKVSARRCATSEEQAAGREGAGCPHVPRGRWPPQEALSMRLAWDRCWQGEAWQRMPSDMTPLGQLTTDLRSLGEGT